MAQDMGAAMSKQRKVHSPAFKAQVALAAHQGDKTINQLAGHSSVHPTLIYGWKKHLVAGAERLFAGPSAIRLSKMTRSPRRKAGTRTCST